jgi:DME family drug/metabolite transporter
MFLVQKRAKRTGRLLVSAAAVLWGTTGVMVQLLREHSSLSPVSIGFYRLAIAAVALLLVGAGGFGPLFVALRAAPLRLIAIGVGLGAYQALYFIAVADAGVSVATVVSLGLAPVLTAGWEAAVARRMPGLVTGLTLAAGVIGLLLISASSGQASSAAPHPLLGLLAAAGSGTGYAAGTVLSRNVSQHTSPMTLATVSTAVGAITLAPLAIVSGLAVPFRPEPLMLLGYLGIVTTALAYAMFYAGLRTTPGSAAAILTLLEPLTAAGLAVLILAEPLAGLTVVGGVILLGAVAALYLEPVPRE